MKTNKLSIYIPISFLIAALFTLIESPVAFITWISFYFIGKYFSNKVIRPGSSSPYTALYYIFTFIGLLICADNFYNFNELVGFAEDDRRYFEAAAHLLGQNEITQYQSEISPYSILLSIIAFPLSIFKTITVADLLPFNWMLAALIGCCICRLGHEILDRNIPFWVLLITYPFNFIISDSLTRLYRDGVLLLFIILSMLCIYHGKKIKSLFLAIPVIFLRFANILMPLLFYLLRNSGVKSTKIIYFSVFAICSAGILFQATILHQAIKHGSEISRTSRYTEAFSSMSAEDAIAFRRTALADTAGNSLHSYAYQNDSIDAVVLRMGIPFLYPLTFENPYGAIPHSSKGLISGFYSFKVINWLSTLSTTLVIPLLIFGLLGARNNHNLAIIAACWITFIFMTVSISGQTRHLLAALILNPIIASNGYYQIASNRFRRIIFILISVILFAFITAYNLQKN